MWMRDKQPGVIYLNIRKIFDNISNYTLSHKQPSETDLAPEGWVQIISESWGKIKFVVDLLSEGKAWH